MMSFLFYFILAQGNAWAHPLDLGLLQLSVHADRVEATFDLSPETTAQILDLKVGQLNALNFPMTAKKLWAATVGSGTFSRVNGPCGWGEPRVEILAQVVRTHVEATCPILEPNAKADFHLAFPFLTRNNLPKTFQVMAKVESGGGERVFFAERGRTEINFDATPQVPTKLGQFILMGIEHIGAAPSEWWSHHRLHFPEGIDHILFLLALILGGGRLTQLMATATGFTVGHSLTLGLAALRIVNLPSRLVESAIAFSIAYVACGNLFQKNPTHRWKLAAAFGLVHGFGFASALSGFNLHRESLLRALVGFNVGVEIGQILLLALLFPILQLARRSPFLSVLERYVGSGAVFAMGTYWFVVRCFAL